MKKTAFLLSIGACVLLGTAFLSSAQETSLFSQANDRYRAKDFSGAEALYQKVLLTGKESASLHYNLGNTYFRMGKAGKAILEYERAHQLSPRDQDIRWNLSILREHTVDQMRPPVKPFFVRGIRRLLSWVTLKETAHLFSLLLFLLALSVTLGAFTPFSKSIPSFITGLLFLALLFSVSLLGLKGLRTQEHYAIVTAEEAPVYYGPSESETRAFLIHEGTKARIVNRVESWVQIEFPDETSGWVSVESLEEI